MEELSIGEVARRTGVAIANLNPQRAVRPRERMNSPLERQRPPSWTRRPDRVRRSMRRRVRNQVTDQIRIIR
jgi:hypothetical protein